jgi:hypothetical protein
MSNSAPQRRGDWAAVVAGRSCSGWTSSTSSFRSRSSGASAAATVASRGDQLVHTFGDVAIVRLARGENRAQALAAYRSRSDVVYAEPDKVGSFAYGPDPYGFCSTCTWEAPRRLFPRLRRPAGRRP